MPPEAILAFDTSAAHCAAALLLGDRITLAHEEMEKGQAERLMPFLQELLAREGITWADLTAIAVGIGPGNFTGVRIAVAAARGLALGLGIPAIGITKLEAVAYGLPRPMTVIEDARRGEVYVQEFTETGAGSARVLSGAEAGAIAGAIAGSGCDGQPATMPLAEAMVRIAATRAQSPQPRPAPFYLRGADASPPSDPPPVILPEPAGL